MSEQGDEGQTPEAPEQGTESGLPPRPTVRESLRRGLFVRLPTERESSEGLSGPSTQQPAETPAPQEQPGAEQYEGWRQAADGTWEQIGEETYTYQEGYETAAPEAYPEIEQSADFASVAGGEPFYTGQDEAAAWTFAAQEAPAPAAEVPAVEEAPAAEAIPALETPAATAPTIGETPVAEVPAVEATPTAEEATLIEPGSAVEAAPVEAAPAPEEVTAAEAASVSEAIPAAAEAPLIEAGSVAETMPVFEAAPVTETAPVTEDVPATEAAPELEATPTAAEAPTEPAISVGEVSETVPELAPATASEASPPMAEDPVASVGLYIPADVELLEGDMPVYGEGENVPPLFEGQGLGEPLFIEFSELVQMLIGLRRLLPAGTRLTYNYDYERAWVRASAEVDLPSFAERVHALEAEDEEKAT
ncbi:MAG: hypothetical protein ABSC51_09310 [Gaiellaceae bacterium]|jgi:hypothetical protein